MPSLTLELRGFHLANRDLFSKSDPYFVISKQTSFGGWIPIRISETVKVNIIFSDDNRSRKLSKSFRMTSIQSGDD